MPVYYYAARDRKGTMVNGTQEAATESLAIGMLQNQGLLITKIVASGTQSQDVFNQKARRHRKVRDSDLIFFIGQTAILLDAGVPLLRSIEIISNLIESRELSRILKEVSDNIRAGSTFKDSIARHPKYFPSFWTFLIEAGETSGTLPIVMKELAKNLESSANLKTKIITALIYPAVLITGSLLAILVFLLKIIPIFEKLFSSFHAKLPALTVVIISFSVFMQHSFLYLLALIGTGIYFLKIYISSPPGRATIDRMVLNAPIFGEAIRDIIHARINLILATVSKSGLNLLKSIEIAARASGNAVYENALNNAALSVQQGKPFSAALRENLVFSPMMVQLIMVGEEGGKLPEMVEKAAQYFTSRVEVFASRISVLIEPIIIIVVGGVVGLIVVAMFMPILSLTQAIH